MRINMDVAWADFKIVDMHLHLPVKQDDWLQPWRDRYIAENGRERWDALVASGQETKSWLSEFCFPTPEPPYDSWEDAADRWAQECRDNDLERVIFTTGGGNDRLSAVVRRYPDLFAGLAHHYIGDVGAADTLERAVREQGLCGYKILAPVVDKPLADRAFDEVFEVCHSYELPVLIHFGILGGGGSTGIMSGPNMSPLAIAETAQRFPRAKFIVPHFGCGFTNELLQLCWASPNVFVDTSGNNLWTKWTMESYTLDQLFAKFYATVGAGRILFGSDSEWFPRGFAARYLLDQLRAVRAVGMPESDVQRIFRDNARAVFKL